MTDVVETTATAANLRRAWDDLIDHLSRARDAIDQPDLYAPPPDDRVLAEGYRYLLGFLYGAIDRALQDPDYPFFRRAIQPVDKATIDNTDAMYLTATIDGEGTYIVRGRAQDHRHWTGAEPAATGRKAPQYVIFETHTHYAGDSGNIEELFSGQMANLGSLDSSQLAVADDGTFEILFAPERPGAYEGNFLPTKAVKQRTQPDGTTAGVTMVARYIVLRELFHDWEREEALDLEVVRVGREGVAPQPLDPPTAAAQMRRIGEIAENQIKYWNEFYTVLLETHSDMNGDGKRFMPRNDLNDPAAAAAARGGGQSTNVYAGGVYELDTDEALIITERVPVRPAFSHIMLSNLWGESLNYANHQCSLNGSQAEADPDGPVRYVIAHRDPGVPNWLDTTTLPVGFMSFRWSYTDEPNELPTTSVKKVAVDKIRDHLHPQTRTISAEERTERIRVRQSHVQRRFRQY